MGPGAKEPQGKNLMVRAFLQDKREWLVPAALFALALAVRLHLLFTHRYPMMIHEQDATGYMAVAEKILSFQPFFNNWRPPAYPFVIALFAFLPIDMELAARIASVFMDALTVIPLYLIGRMFLSRSGSTAAALLWCFFSFSLYFCISPLSQSTFLFFLCCAVLFFIHGAGEEKWQDLPFLLSGIFFAISYQARPEGVVAFGAAMALSMLSVMVKKDWRRLRGPLFLVAGFLLAAGPYLVFLRLDLGYWGLTAKSDAAVKTIDGILTLDARGNLSAATNGIAAWQEHYGNLANFLSQVRGNVAAFARVFFGTFPLWVYFIAAIGGCALAVRREWRSLACIAILAASTLPNYIVNIPKSHSYLYAVFPALFLLFASLWDLLGGFADKSPGKIPFLPEGGMRRLLVAAVVLVPSLALSAFSYGQGRDALDEMRQEAIVTERVYKEAGEFIRSASRPEERIMTRWGLIGYFAGRGVVTLPKGGVAEVLDYGRRNGASFLVLDTNSVLSRRQELMELLAPLEGKQVDPRHRIQVVRAAYYPDLGGYVIYRYAP